MEGAGPLNDESRVGFYNHVMLAVTPERIPLGLVDADIWARDWEEFRENQKNKQAKERKRKHQSIEEKESFRWLQGYRRGCQVAEQVLDTKLVVVSDSEGDIFECFAEARREAGVEKAEWIVRACQDRSLSTDHERKLLAEVASSEVLGTMEVTVSKNQPRSKNDRKRKQPRSARTATLTIQATQVMLQGPWRPGGRLAKATVNAVLVRETSKPPKGEERIDWLLLTSLPIKTIKQVCLAIDYNGCRWQIEVEFRGLKQTIDKRNLRCRNCDRVYAELDWSIRTMAFAELIALREQIPNDNERRTQSEQDYDVRDRSLANTICALRKSVRNSNKYADSGTDLLSHLTEALVQKYNNRTVKKARYLRNNPDKKPLGEPQGRKFNSILSHRLRR